MVLERLVGQVGAGCTVAFLHEARGALRNARTGSATCDERATYPNYILDKRSHTKSVCSSNLKCRSVETANVMLGALHKRGWGVPANFTSTMAMAVNQPPTQRSTTAAATMESLLNPMDPARLDWLAHILLRSTNFDNILSSSHNCRNGLPPRPPR